MYAARRVTVYGGPESWTRLVSTSFFSFSLSAAQIGRLHCVTYIVRGHYRLLPRTNHSGPGSHPHKRPENGPSQHLAPCLGALLSSPALVLRMERPFVEAAVRSFPLSRQGLFEHSQGGVRQAIQRHRYISVSPLVLPCCSHYFFGHATSCLVQFPPSTVACLWLIHASTSSTGAMYSSFIFSVFFVSLLASKFIHLCVYASTIPTRSLIFYFPTFFLPDLFAICIARFIFPRQVRSKLTLATSVPATLLAYVAPILVPCFSSITPLRIIYRWKIQSGLRKG